jgi:hypothetical protein
LLVVDQREQRGRGPVGGLGEMTLGRVERRLEQQLGGAEHAVHGRANLVADGRQELRLGDVRLLGAAAGLLEIVRLRLEGELLLLEAVDQLARRLHRLAHPVAQPLGDQAGEREVDAEQVHRRGDRQSVDPERLGRSVAPDPARVGEVGGEDDVIEVDRPAKAVADLIGDPHQQQVGEEQMRLLQVAQVGQPDQEVEVNEDKAEIEGAGPAVPRAQCRPAQHRVADVQGEQDRELRPVDRCAHSHVLKDGDDAQDGEATGANRGDLYRVEPARSRRPARREQVDIEREAGVGVQRRGECGQRIESFLVWPPFSASPNAGPSVRSASDLDRSDRPRTLSRFASPRCVVNR